MFNLNKTFFPKFSNPNFDCHPVYCCRRFRIIYCLSFDKPIPIKPMLIPTRNFVLCIKYHLHGSRAEIGGNSGIGVSSNQSWLFKASLGKEEKIAQHQ